MCAKETGCVSVLPRAIPPFICALSCVVSSTFSHARKSCIHSLCVCSTNKMAIASDRMIFYYMARDNLCFLTLCEEAYPKRLAFLYLDEIADLILQELLQEYGSNVRKFLECGFETTARSQCSKCTRAYLGMLCSCLRLLPSILVSVAHASRPGGASLSVYSL
jgi:Regulated-SNARE-like domain